MLRIRRGYVASSGDTRKVRIEMSKESWASATEYDK